MKIKLQADEQNGISLVESFDEGFDELTKENILMDCLKDTTCLPLYAEISLSTLRDIKEFGYTVHDLRVIK